MLVLAVVLAGVLRFYALGEWPPGLYRDEAFNGLDALAVLRGEHAVFFPANNGREPLYIYLASVAVNMLGPTSLAVRLPAAVAGTLATIPVFLLARAWFGRVTGLSAAFLWAITFWPLHLSRIGLRVVLLAPLLALAFWLGTLAYRRGKGWLWLAAGLIYGLTFYSYLAARFTPLLLAAVMLYLLATGRREALWSNGRSLLFLVGAAIALLPLAGLVWQDPSLILGRSGQVSILNPAVNGGDFWGTLLRQAGRGLGLYLWRGDTILRHNALLNYDAILPEDGPAGRPVFDPLMAIPFLIGLVICLRQWRQPAAATLLMWQITMLGPTILAEDAPHFLRAAGLLPAAVLLPAIGLAEVWDWERLPALLRHGLVAAVIALSLVLTARDYARYSRQPDVGYLFESAARELAESALATDESTAIRLDGRFWQGWPSIQYLLYERPVTLFDAAAAQPALERPAVIYAWPYASLDAVQQAVPSPALLDVTVGPLARGDLEPEPYPLYVRYAVQPGPVPLPGDASFDGWLLREATAELSPTGRLNATLIWEAGREAAPVEEQLPSVFLQLVGPDGVIAQQDGPPAAGYWPAGRWQPGLAVRESRTLDLPQPYDKARHQLIAGLYWPQTGERLLLPDGSDHVIVPVAKE